MSNRILLVEDDQSFGAVLKDYLMTVSYTHLDVYKRQEKHDYLEEKKLQKLEDLLKIAREEDKKSKEEQK